MKNSNLYKNTIYYFLNAVLTALFGVLINKLFSLFIEPSEYGAYSLTLSIYTLLTSIIIMFYTNNILRFYKDYDNEKRLETLYAIIIKLIAIMVVLYIVIALIIIPIIKPLIGSNVYFELIILFMLLFLPDGIKQITISLARCRGEAKRQTLSNIIEQLIKIVVFLICFFLIKKSVSAIIYGSLAGAIFSILFLRTCWEKPRKKIEKNEFKNELKQLLQYGIPLMGIPIVNYLLSTSDQLIIKVYRGEHDTGIYSMGYKIANALLSVITTFLITSTHHKIMETYKKNGKKRTEAMLKDLSLLYWIISIPFLICTILFSDTIISILSSEEYMGSSIVLSLSSIGIVFCGYINYTNKAWEVSKKTNVIMILSGVGAVINIILNLLLVPKYGYTAASVTTIISYILVVCLSSLCGKKILNIAIPLKILLRLMIVASVSMISAIIIKKMMPNSLHGSIICIIFSLFIYCGLIWFTFKERIIKIITAMKHNQG